MLMEFVNDPTKSEFGIGYGSAIPMSKEVLYFIGLQQQNTIEIGVFASIVLI